MASHHLIQAHLAVLAERLPPGIVDELTDGLIETWHAHLTAGIPPDTAARAAIDEFGAPDEICEAFIAQSPGRRLTRRLLLTGPIVGACWAAAFITTQAWSWPIPPAGAAVFGIGLLAVIAALVTGGRSPASYRTTRIAGAAGAIGTIMLDSTLLAALLLVNAQPSWALAVAIPASLTRILLTLRLLPTLATT